MIDKRELEIIEFIKKNREVSSSEIFEGLSTSVSYATVKRRLSRLIDENLLTKKGQGKSTKYLISPSYEILYPVDIEKYYEKEIDERDIRGSFNLQLIPKTLKECSVFTTNELVQLGLLQKKFEKNIAQLSETEYKKELERLAIDLSWKSSQIEGNTYSLLETERLLKEKETASGKTKEEAIMLLNHKEAIDFIIEPSNIFVSGIFFNTSMAFELISIALSEHDGIKFLNAIKFSPILEPNSRKEFTSFVLDKIFENTAVLWAMLFGSLFLTTYSLPKSPAQNFSCSVLKFILLFIFPYSFSFSISPYFCYGLYLSY
jgi:hypothetical protein